MMMVEGQHELPQGNLVFAQSSVSNLIPAEVDKHIDALEFGENGELFLATSNLNRRSWTGDLWWFASAEDAPHRNKAKAGYRFNSGIVSVKYIGNRQVVLGLDMGGIQLVSLKSVKDEKDKFCYYLDLVPSPCEHDERIGAMDCWKGQSVAGGQQMLTGTDNRLVTGGLDGRIVVWNQHQVVYNNYYPAHPTGVISVSCHPTNNNIFASAGQDGQIKVWDVRDDRPCETVYSDPSHPPTTISWFREDDTNKILVAAKTGSVFTLDVKTKEAKSHIFVSDRDLRTISWSTDRPHLAATSGDDVNVYVINTQNDELKIEYTSSAQHMDFVRALAWGPAGNLWSGGWDRRVAKHIV